MTFVEEGRLALDEPLPVGLVPATLRQLLSHQGALDAGWSPGPSEVGDGDDALLRLVDEGRPNELPIQPGELFAYSNTGFWVVGAAAARLDGTTFEESLRRRVLGPLGLDATGFDRPPDAAVGHVQVEPGSTEYRPTEDSVSRAGRPSGGLCSTVSDLLAFGVHHLGGRGPLRPESVAEMQRQQVATEYGGYGLGWGLRGSDRGAIVEHGGSSGGYESLLLLAPDHGFALAALTNSSRGSKAIDAIVARLGFGVPPRPRVELGVEALEAFRGHYEGRGFTIDVEPLDGAIRVAVIEDGTVHPPARAEPVGPTTFEVVDGDEAGEPLDFPRPGLIRYGLVATRVD
jgi:CubicO group peptidase (beta-lactamase class C family)